MTPSQRRGLVTILLGLLSVGACGPQGPSLAGSLDQFFPLTFTSHQVVRVPNAFQVSYFNQTPNEVDVVAQLTVVTNGFDFSPGKSFDLSGEYAPGHPRAVVTHVVGNATASVLPPIARGVLTLDEGGQVGQTTRGSFDVLFGDGGDFGAGRTLTGTFVTTAVPSGD
jgi:hypothetical protein